jgi:hypothetical protein
MIWVFGVAQESTIVRCPPLREPRELNRKPFIPERKRPRAMAKDTKAVDLRGLLMTNDRKADSLC